MQEKTTTMNYSLPGNSSTEYQSTLSYYKQKVEELYKERLAWLSKFDQCNSKLTEKHHLKEKLKKLKQDQQNLSRSYLHHNIAILDQKLNVLRMERQNFLNDFKDAEQIIKIQKLLEDYPLQVDKQVPCKNINFNNKQIIQNQLNIHCKSSSNSQSKKKINSNFNLKKAVQQNSKNQINSIKKIRVNPQDLLGRQIVQLKRSQGLQIETMQNLIHQLQDNIQSVKNKQSKSLQSERGIVDQLQKEYRKLDDKHKKLADDYFSQRRKIKDETASAQKQKQYLNQTYLTFEQKVNKQLKMYQKQNKAKQTLIIKRSEDFQEDYKARMRAKQRNLQALKQNYQKMQKVCIEKVNKLESALDKAKSRLKQAQSRRQFLVNQLRDQLHILQKRVQQQKIEKAQLDKKLKEKADKQKQRSEEIRQRQEKQNLKKQKNRQIDEAYRRNKIQSQKNPRDYSKSKQKSISRERKKNKKTLKDTIVNGNQNQRSNKKSKNSQKYQQGQQQSEQEDSLQMSDLQNIRKQINQLQHKIASDQKTR